MKKDEVKSGKPAQSKGLDAGFEKAVKAYINLDKKQTSQGKSARQGETQVKSDLKNAKKKSVNAEFSCKHFKKCGGCQHLDQSYEHQLSIKQKQVETLLKHHCTVHPIIGMENPYHYRNKVQAVFSRDMRGNIISGTYKEGTHQVISIDTCLIEDQKADDIIRTIRNMLKSFKIKTYDEDTGYGLLRYVLVKRGFTSKEIMVVLVIGSPVFPSKNNFVKALREAHPEISTIVLNVNDRTDSMILGNRETVLYGKGYIEDTLCGNVFRISSKSFYQVNPVQTEILYGKAMKAANLTGKETVIDAYCGIGTIGLVAAKNAKEVIGVELNKDAFKDAIANAKRNEIQNVKFYNADATEFMVKLAAEKKAIDVVFMDPPRNGSTDTFIESVASLAPKKVVYVSCNPVTLERDLRVFEKQGYEAKEAWPVDMFPWTGHVETVCLLSRRDK
jgi:23S rRNA (uracil1939-C5)-methyltransferase